MKENRVFVGGGGLLFNFCSFCCVVLKVQLTFNATALRAMLY